MSVAGVGLTGVGAYDEYDDDADGDISLRSRSKRVDRFSEIPDVSKEKNAPADQCGLLTPSKKGT